MAPCFPLAQQKCLEVQFRHGLPHHRPFLRATANAFNVVVGRQPVAIVCNDHVIDPLGSWYDTPRDTVNAGGACLVLRASEFARSGASPNKPSIFVSFKSAPISPKSIDVSPAVPSA